MVHHVAIALLHAMLFALSMGWDILWALILGFLLSGVVQAVVTKGEMGRLLPDAGPRSILIASGLGAASSSCSYAAVALARSIFRKGGNFTAAMAFQFASTNLVLELGIILAVLIGWQFTLAEFVGGPIMIVLMVAVLRRVMTDRRLAAARDQAERGRQGRMEGHAAMDMSVGGEGTVLSRAISPKGFTAISHFFVMDWASVWTDIALGLLISGALAAWVPHQFWQTLFLAHDRIGSVLVGPLIGPLVAIISFVCSVGNVPLAAVLWNGGISFGGVVAFIFADLIILPILDIYRKYYGWRIAGLLFLVFYAAMALAGYAVELLFGVSGLIPAKRHATVAMASVSWNYTTVLNIVFLVIAAMLIWRFMRTGGPDMLRMMAAPAPTNAGSDGHAHHHHS
ncbi:permease [Acidiphilium sp. PA]|uniref:permease n=2 Tax=Acidiphilium TaxID=522 RepID=UPI002243D6AB|nr:MULTISPECIES: permease [unclassified Acidiphilium]MCW8309130.1 permease [Acidiphilium sp. PA]